jgi:hypothetical protein
MADLTDAQLAAILKAARDCLSDPHPDAREQFIEACGLAGQRIEAMSVAALTSHETKEG